MTGVQLYTPRDENLSAGMVCYDVKGMEFHREKPAAYGLPR